MNTSTPHPPPAGGSGGGEASLSAEHVGADDPNRLRALLDLCFDDGLFPDTNIDFGETKIIDGIGYLSLNQEVDTATVNWLKARTVIVLFDEPAMSLSVAQREQLIRVYEGAWYQEVDINPTQKRGRTHGEGPNVSSYVARTERIAQWLTAKGEDRIPTRNGSVKVRFKPWMTRQELDVIRDNKAAGKFRIIALRVPLEALPSLRFAVQRFMGRVLVMHPPERRADEPRLGNIRIDCVSEVRQTFLEWIVVRKSTGGFVEVQFANQDTPFCNKCLWWYHDEFDSECPRFSEPMPEERGGRRARGRGARGRGRGSGPRGPQGQPVGGGHSIGRGRVNQQGRGGPPNQHESQPMSTTSELNPNSRALVVYSSMAPTETVTERGTGTSYRPLCIGTESRQAEERGAPVQSAGNVQMRTNQPTYPQPVMTVRPLQRGQPLALGASENRVEIGGGVAPFPFIPPPILPTHPWSGQDRGTMQGTWCVPANPIGGGLPWHPPPITMENRPLPGSPARWGTGQGGAGRSIGMATGLVEGWRTAPEGAQRQGGVSNFQGWNQGASLLPRTSG
ncbi:hypothetical protein CBR_g39151 [Chara braunii]|uniref:Uncharacterized protein n=1 Tax=Chara braunii TaxID=69332 RepID=A0A388LR32_CHABU|nr:hypothetical protein CBR_g39151 [Chara braunii]|eukprot:GBG84774.1 hypothetical protein CBR_g39151 [Chara braunii]